MLQHKDLEPRPWLAVVVVVEVVVVPMTWRMHDNLRWPLLVWQFVDVVVAVLVIQGSTILRVVAQIPHYHILHTHFLDHCQRVLMWGLLKGLHSNSEMCC